MFGWGLRAGPIRRKQSRPTSIHVRLRANGLRPITQPVRPGATSWCARSIPMASVVRVLFNARYGNIVVDRAAAAGADRGRGLRSSVWALRVARALPSRATERRRPISRSSLRRVRTRCTPFRARRSIAPPPLRRTACRCRVRARPPARSTARAAPPPAASAGGLRTTVRPRRPPP